MKDRYNERAAWIVEWELEKSNLPKLDARPHILPWRWESRRVFDYMRCLFWNSALRTPFETLDEINRGKPTVWTLCDGPRLMYGDASAHLMAWRVSDLRIREKSYGKFLMEWTAPAVICINPKESRPVEAGDRLKRLVVFRG